MIWTGGFQGRAGTAGGQICSTRFLHPAGPGLHRTFGIVSAAFGPLLHSLFANILENKRIRSEFELILVPSIEAVAYGCRLGRGPFALDVAQT